MKMLVHVNIVETLKIGVVNAKKVNICSYSNIMCYWVYESFHVYRQISTRRIMKQFGTTHLEKKFCKCCVLMANPRAKVKKETQKLIKEQMSGKDDK